jgi:hypothetical protein
MHVVKSLKYLYCNSLGKQKYYPHAGHEYVFFGVRDMSPVEIPVLLQVLDLKRMSPDIISRAKYSLHVSF